VHHSAEVPLCRRGRSRRRQIAGVFLIAAVIEPGKPAGQPCVFKGGDFDQFRERVDPPNIGAKCAAIEDHVPLKFGLAENQQW